MLTLYPIGVYNECGDMMKEENSSKTKTRSCDDIKYLIKRLNVIEGQVRGVKQMIENNRYCGDVLIQMSAINKSLQTLGNFILKEHMKTCVVQEIKNDNLEVIDEVLELMSRLS